MKETSMTKAYLLKKQMFSFLVLSAVFMLLSCGGGGGGDSTPSGNGITGGADQVSFLMSSGTTTVRTETVDTLDPISPTFFDPHIIGNYVRPSAAPGSDKTFIYSYSDFDGTGFSEILSITFQGNAAGSFAIGGKNAVSIVTRSSGFIASTGTITVDGYEGVGGHISGSFSVSNATKTLSGTFSVTRGTDE
jgi:hypothetical protein